MSSSSRSACDSSNETAGVPASGLGIRWWARILRAARQRLSSVDRYKWGETYPASDWLRRDIGLTEDVMTSRSDRIDEIKRKHSGWF
jgi:hypothetical protein